MIDTVLAAVFIILGSFVFIGMAKMDRDVNTPEEEGGNDMFIEITVEPNDTKLLINKNHITVVQPMKEAGTRIEITSDNGAEFYFATETYEEIRKELKPAKEITVTIPGIADGGQIPDTATYLKEILNKR